MAAVDCDIELEDGEINDLEDGEIDDDVLLSTEASSNVFSRLEPRHSHADLVRDKQESHRVNSRDFGIQSSGPPSDRWELQGGSFASSSRGRFPRGRESPATARGKIHFRESEREMMGRNRSLLGKRPSQRRPFFQRPNLPHPHSPERVGPPYNNKRTSCHQDNERMWLAYATADSRQVLPHFDERHHAYSDNERPRLPHPSLLDRSRVPLMELDKKTWSSHNEIPLKTLPEPDKQPGRIPSLLDDEEVDDYRILLQRHRLIQQQLAALEKQETSSLAEEDRIIDDSFIDIPVEDTHTQPGLQVFDERNLGNLAHCFRQAHKQDEEFSSQQLSIDRNMSSSEMRNDIYGLLESESSGDGVTQKTFLPFKIKSLHNNVPSIKELSQKDLEQRVTRKYTEHGAQGIDRENQPVEENNQAQTQDKRRGQVPRARKNRRKRKRKPSLVETQVMGVVNNESTGNASLLQVAHVDPHNELEARLMSLAGSSVSNHGEAVANREDTDKKRERRERLRQWQERMNKKDISNQKNQSGNKARPKKKVAKPSRSGKRRSNGNQREEDRDSRRRMVNFSKFESDDYFEIPMEVESDSTDGPALPLIEEPVEDFPPPPPPVPNGDFVATTSAHADQLKEQQSLMMYPSAYFHLEQNYPDWPIGSVPVKTTAFDDQVFKYGELTRNKVDVHVEESHGMTKVHTPDISSQDNSDEDDEAALREQLLKSLAVKRKAKLGVKKPKSSTDGPARESSCIQPPSTVYKEQDKNKQQSSRQVSYVAPPKHDPVVIKLGEDSDSEESAASDSEVGQKTGSKSKGSGGGLFGGLEMMIKEARKSAEASKVKGSQKETVSLAQDDTGQPVKTDTPAVPKTPDAMDHMPEQMKTEYRRLKEQLAQREKTKHPLVTVNQDKEDSSKSVASEGQAEKITDSDTCHLRELHSYVTGCDENLANHKKLIQQDKTTLAKMLGELKEKSQSLEVQEANLRKLQQQLEAARKITLANRLLVQKLCNRTKIVKEKVTKKQAVASNFEEELLRAKSILSAVKRRMPTVGDTGSGRNSPQSEPLSSAGNEKQTFSITPAISQEIKSSLAAKLAELSTLNKLENRERRKLDGTSDSAEETSTKKPKAPYSTPEVSPASSAPNTPSKSARAQRIAQEKARLKKLEHELSEKLKLFGRQQEEGGDEPSILQSKPSKRSKTDPSDVEKSGREHRNRLPVSSERTGNSIGLVTERQEVNSKEQHPQWCENQEVNPSLRDSDKPTARRLSVSPEQLQRITKLQAEKDMKGPQFSPSSLDVPLSAHQRSILCVSLPFGGELTSIVTDQHIDSSVREEQVAVSSVARPISTRDDDEGMPCPLKKYKSQLLHFKSYRLSPYFRIEGGFSLTSLTFSNKLNPVWPLCNFDLQGQCNDEDCRFQHFIDCKLSQEQTLQDLAAYNPTLSADGHETKEQQESVESFTKAFSKQYQDKMSWEELCILLVNEVKKQRKGSGPFHVYFEPRTWKLKKEVEKQEECMDESADDLGRGIIFTRKDKVHTAVAQPRDPPTTSMGQPAIEESQEVRYFGEEYNNTETLEASLETSPADVALWIKLARLQLRQSFDGVDSDHVDLYHQDNVTQALSTLSRGLEENTHSEELWLEYLELYSSRCNQDELREICDQAVEFSPTYSVWWKYLEYSTTYHAKKTVCLRLLSFLVTNPVDPVELHSHHMLEVLLYLVQLELYSGHYKSALSVFKEALGKKAADHTDIPDLSVHLLPSDRCLAWLAYIHVFEFHRPPAAWFDSCDDRPSQMVTKEDFVFPWKPSQQSRAPGEKLLVLFQDALKACRVAVKSSSARLAVCLPLYKNLIALERAYGRIDSAKGICRHLLKDNPSVVVLWLCLAALEDAVLENRDAKKVYEEALEKCKGHAEVSYSAARYYLEKNDVQKAMSVLNKCVYYKFASASKSPKREVQSLAAIPSEQEGVDAVALYRKLLSQPLPYNYRCPPYMSDVTPHSLRGEKLFLWLCYCLLLEISPPCPTLWDNLSVESAFETAVHSPLDRQDVQTLWTEYLFYQRSKSMQREISLPVHQQVMSELINRCLMSVSTSSSLPHSSGAVWQDYRFHNQVIGISVSCIPQSCWSEEFKKYQRFFPGSVSLALWSCKNEVERKNHDQAKKICAAFLSENPYSISMWKVAIAIELQRNCIKEARKMYQQATKVLPFAATLWKDFLMFELAQNGDGTAVQEIVAQSREIGVDLKDYLNTLLGK